MELQADNSSQTRPSANQRSTAPPSSAPPSTSTSVSTIRLRFPRPQVNQKLANYLSNSSSDIREALSMSESGSLADSAYEIINSTDSESQDSHMSESIGSLDIPRPDDVHSLDGSENHYDTDTDDESDHSSHASSIRYADQALQSPSTHVSVNTLRYNPAPAEASGVVTDSIEFQEDAEEPLGLDKILANRIIREYAEKETSELAKQLKMPVAPRRLVTTVRQTMSQAYLSPKEPLRVLYVGRPEAKRNIVLKISSAIWVSSENSAAGGNVFGRQREEVYNIVPISSFGSSPELDLMEGSYYQIKVEHCTSAFEHSSRDQDAESASYSITIGHDLDKTYSTNISSEGDIIQPPWELPHVAVFYCADDEDLEEVQTRRAAWKFMKGHNVPSIFISESETIDKPLVEPWEERVDEHAAHLCLESRDSERAAAPPRRFPIDLASFLNIDARQMNRNLAYLTGLSESTGKTGVSVPIASKTPWQTNLKNTWPQKPTREQVLHSIEHNKWFVAMIVPIFMAMFAPYLIAVFSGWRGDLGTSPVQQASLTNALGLSSTSCAAGIPATARSISTSTTTVVINVTSTKTVQIAHVLPTTSSVASVLSFAGFLSDKPSAASIEPEVKKTVCAVRVHSPNELLVAIPSGSKLTRLAKDAIGIDVYRGDELVKTKRFSVSEGIIVQLKQRDAHGTLNVSVITSRKPKVNETFEVDFGKTTVTEALEAGIHLLKDISKMVYSTFHDATSGVEPGKLKEEVFSAWNQALEAGKKQYGEAVKRVKSSLPNYQQARDTMSGHLETVKALQKEADLSILRAQVASKLWWLKIQGKEEEFAAYQHNATIFIKAKYAEMLRGKDGRARASTTESRNPYGRCWRRCQRNDDEAKPGDSKDRRWKRMIMG